MKKQMLLKGNYIHQDEDFLTQTNIVTQVQIEDEEGMCLVNTKAIGEIGFSPNWSSESLRGYHQSSGVPDGMTLSMDNAKKMWSCRLPENGAIFFFETKQERDDFIGE
jgi:hypothetical protein